MPRLLTPPVPGPLLLRRVVPLAAAAAVVAGSDFPAPAAVPSEVRVRAAQAVAVLPFVIRMPLATLTRRIFRMVRMLRTMLTETSCWGRRIPPLQIRLRTQACRRAQSALFAMESGEQQDVSRNHACAARSLTSPPQPANSRMIPVMPAPYSRRVYVYIPRQYVAGTVAPFIVGADGPERNGAVHYAR